MAMVLAMEVMMMIVNSTERKGHPMNRLHGVDCQCTLCWQADSQTLPTQAYEQPNENGGA